MRAPSKLIVEDEAPVLAGRAAQLDRLSNHVADLAAGRMEALEPPSLSAKPRRRSNNGS